LWGYGKFSVTIGSYEYMWPFAEDIYRHPCTLEATSSESLLHVEESLKVSLQDTADNLVLILYSVQFKPHRDFKG
jgi:hypothetical protein